MGFTHTRALGFAKWLEDQQEDEAPSTHSVAVERTDGADEYVEAKPGNLPDAWPVIRLDILYREHMNLLCKAGLQMGSWLSQAGGIGAEDTLLVVDMQNDFMPVKCAPYGGRAAVAEGEAVVEPVTELIEAFSRRGALIVATRAFHPADHISFYEQGGPLPSHCVQTTPGSCFYPAVAEALHLAHTAPLLECDEYGLPCPAGRVEIAFKGILEDVASPGAFRYDQEHYEKSLRHCRWELPSCPLRGVQCAEPWTGALALKCSNLTNDIDANPDLSALLQPDLRPLHEVIPRSGRLLIVGLALDTSILETAVAASRLGYEKVFVAIDACRASHFGITGEYGSGFLTDPAYIVSQFEKHDINIVQSGEVLRTLGDSPKLRKGRSPSPVKGGA